jgi:hypothetical protein
MARRAGGDLRLLPPAATAPSAGVPAGAGAAFELTLPLAPAPPGRG